MKEIVRTAADILYPLALVFGFYVVLHGHLTPGGGFQGGAVIATAFALMFAAYRYAPMEAAYRKTAFGLSEIAGLVLFALLGFGGIFIGTSFLQNWMASGGGVFGDAVSYGSNPGNLNTGGLVPVLNIAIGFEVLGAVSLIIYYMLTYLKHPGREEKKDAA